MVIAMHGLKKQINAALYHAQNTPEALQAYVAKKNVMLFEELNVLSERELNARLNVDLEHYTLAFKSRVEH